PRKPRAAFVDARITAAGGEPLELQCLEVGDGNRRQNLKRHVIGEVRLAIDDAFECFLVSLDELDFRLLRGTFVAILDDLGARIVERLLHHFLHQRFAVELFQMRQRDLAATEAFDLYPVLEFIETLCEALAQLSLRDDHLQGALQSVSCRFRNLHRPFPDWRPVGLIDRPIVWEVVCLSTNLLSRRPPKAHWCGRRDLNPHDFRRLDLNQVRLPVPPRPRPKSVFAFRRLTFNTIGRQNPAQSFTPAPNGASRPAIIRRRPAHKAGEPLSYAGAVPKTMRKSQARERP